MRYKLDTIIQIISGLEAAGLDHTFKVKGREISAVRLAKAALAAPATKPAKKSKQRR